MSGTLPERGSESGSIGTFLGRLIWRREVGPLSAEASVEVRELAPEPEPLSAPPYDDDL